MSLIVMITLLVVPFAVRMARRNQTARRVDDGPLSPSTLLQRRSDSSISAAEEAHRMTAPAKRAPAKKAAARKEGPAKEGRRQEDRREEGSRQEDRCEEGTGQGRRRQEDGRQEGDGR